MSYVGDNKPYVGLIISYVGHNRKSYVGLIISYVRDLGLIFLFLHMWH